MKSHGMNFIGKLWIQQVEILPTWTVQDLARVVYCGEDGIVYVGGCNGWVAIGSIFHDQGTATDPDTLETFYNRLYTIKIVNGNLTYEYET